MELFGATAPQHCRSIAVIWVNTYIIMYHVGNMYIFRIHHVEKFGLIRKWKSEAELFVGMHCAVCEYVNIQ